MSFNQKSGKIQQKRSSIKWNRIELYRKPVVVFQQKLNSKSQRETNIQSCIYDHNSTRYDSRLILPSIIPEKPLHDSSKLSNKNKFKNKFFTEESNSKNDYEQNLFPVKQKEKSIPVQNKNVMSAWYKKLRKKQQNIILNYLNTKVQVESVKNKKKRKLNKSMSNQRIIEKKSFVVVPTSQLKRHRRNFSQFKTQKVDKITKANEKFQISRRQSLPVYAPQQSNQTLNQSINSEKQSKTIENLKEKIKKMQKHQAYQQTQLNEENRLNFTQQSKIKSRETAKSRPFRNQFYLQKKEDNIMQNDKQTKRQNNKEEYSFIKALESRQQEDLIINKHFDMEIKQKSNIQEEESQIKNSIIPKKQTDASQNNYGNLNQDQEPEDKKDLSQQNKSDLTIDLKQWTERQTISLLCTTKNEDQHPEKEKEQKLQILNQTIKSEESEEKPQKLNLFLKQTNQVEALQEIKNKDQNCKQSLASKDSHLCKNFPTRIPDKSFLKIKTYYAQVDKKAKFLNPQSSIKELTETYSLKQVPKVTEITSFIETYKPENDKISIQQLAKHEKFKILFKQSNQLYFGLIENGLKSRYGVTLKKNYLFEGMYKQGKKIKGIQINQVGKYIGEFQNNKRQGKGEFFWKNGQKYIGEWKNGKKHGKGNWKSFNGDLYDGQWVQGKVEGYGVHILPNGQTYEGFFHEFLKSGCGKQILPNGDHYQGEFAKGKPHGKGKYCWSSGQVYEGQFQKGFRQGYGILTDGQKNIYKGEFKTEKATGECEIHFKSQDFYQGSINNGCFDGQGTLKLDQQNQEWTGTWVLDEFINPSDQSDS